MGSDQTSVIDLWLLPAIQDWRVVTHALDTGHLIGSNRHVVK